MEQVITVIISIIQSEQSYLIIMIRILLARKITINHHWSRNAVTTMVWRPFLALTQFSTLIILLLPLILSSSHIPFPTSPWPERPWYVRFLVLCRCSSSYLECPFNFSIWQTPIHSTKPITNITLPGKAPLTLGKSWLFLSQCSSRTSHGSLCSFSTTLTRWSPH